MSVRYTSYSGSILSEYKQKKSRTLEIVGSTVEGHAKEKLQQNRSVQTGRLIGGVAHERRDENTEAVGTDVEYAPYVELGHNQQPGRYVPAIGKRLVASHVAAKPFLKPAVMDHTDEIVQIVQQEMSF